MASLDPEFSSLEENSVDSGLDLDESKATSGESDKLEKKSMFFGYEILKGIRKNGSAEYLHNLRQLSSIYYEIMAPRYFELMDLTVEISAYRNCKPECYNKSKCNRPCTMSVRKGSKIKALENEKSITHSNWTHGMAYMFRNLIIGDIWYNQMNISTLDGLSVQNIITQLCPYISKLSIHYIPKSLDFENTGEQLSAFLAQFTSLKVLDISYEIAGGECCDRNYLDAMPVNDLKTVLENLNPNIQIELSTCKQNKCTEIANTFGTGMKNLSIFLDFPPGYDIDSWRLEEKKVFEKYAKVTNVMFRFKSIYIDNLGEVNSFVNTLVRYQHLIQHVAILLCIRVPSEQSPYAYGEDENTQVKEQLKTIIPVLNTLHIGFETGVNKFNIFDIPNCDWSNLQSLLIYYYDLPLEVLKKCTNLIHLILKVNLGSCIFHNPEQTPEENVKEYFGNLGKLERLEFVFGEGMERDFHFSRLQGPKNQKEFRSLLKKMLPTDARIEFEGYLKEY